ncbi:MAG: hypothetical protein KDA75_06115 [Planctomycetaceae bacterium]|nr:hypothetical protein [Planctomycetaceae bacterium]
MRTHGRYLRFRHVFPELFGPGVQARRGLLRFRWFLLQRIDFRPIWTLGAAAGLGGVLLTVTLFFVQGLLRPAVAAREIARIEPVTVPPPVIVPPPLQPAPIEQPLLQYPPIVEQLPQPQLTPMFERLSMPFGWSDRNLATAYSTPQPMELNLSLSQQLDPNWVRASFRTYPSTFPQTFMPYREPSGLRWNAVTPDVRVSNVAGSASDVTPLARPTAIIEKQMPQTSTGVGPVEYRLIVRNPSNAPIPDVTVFEAVDVNRVTDAQPPARVEPNGLLWKLAGLAPGEERTLAVTVWTEGLAVLNASTDVEFADRVSTRIRVEGTVETPFFEREPAVNAPAIELPAFPQGNELPPWPTFDDPQPAPRPIVPVTPAQQELPAFPDFPAPTPTPAPQPQGRPILKITAEPPMAVAVGEDATTWYEISNIGTAAATNIVLKLRLPDGLQHHDGAQSVEFSLPRLDAGKSRRARLVTRALTHGSYVVSGELTSGDILETSTVQLFAPEARRQTEPVAGDEPETMAPRDRRGAKCQCTLLVRRATFTR